MTNRSTRRQPAWRQVRLRSCARSIVLITALAVLGAIGEGCVATQRRPAAGAGGPPPQVPETAVGAAAVGQDQPSASETDFHETATDRQRFQVHIDFGRVFETQGNFDAAVLEYQDALTVLETRKRGSFQPTDNALAHRRMGGALDRLGRFAQAEVHYKKALKLSPKDARIWNDAGYSYYLQGRWADAERLFTTAMKLAPEDERVRVNLGLTLAAAGKPDQAFPFLSQSSGDAVGHANLGYLLAATGQTDLARRQYETALALRPELDVAHRALATLDQEPGVVVQARTVPDTSAPIAQATAAPFDAGLSRASAPRAKIPPPSRKVFPMGPTALPPLDPPPLPPAPPSDLDLSDLPPPPPL